MFLGDGFVEVPEHFDAVDFFQELRVSRELQESKNGLTKQREVFVAQLAEVQVQELVVHVPVGEQVQRS